MYNIIYKFISRKFHIYIYFQSCSSTFRQRNHVDFYQFPSNTFSPRILILNKLRSLTILNRTINKIHPLQWSRTIIRRQVKFQWSADNLERLRSGAICPKVIIASRRIGVYSVRFTLGALFNDGGSRRERSLIHSRDPSGFSRVVAPLETKHIVRI